MRKTRAASMTEKAAKTAGRRRIYAKTAAIILTFAIGGGGAATGFLYEKINAAEEAVLGLEEEELIGEIREVSGLDYAANNTFSLDILNPDGVMPSINGMSTEIPDKSFFMGIKKLDLDEDGEEELLAAVLLGADRLDNHFEEDCVLVQAYEFNGESYQVSDEITYAKNLYYWTSCQLDVFVDATERPVVGLMYSGGCYGFSDGMEYDLLAYTYDGQSFVPSRKVVNLPFLSGQIADNSINAYHNSDAPSASYSQGAAENVYQVCRYIRETDLSPESAARTWELSQSASPGSVIRETTVTIVREFENSAEDAVGMTVIVTDGEPEEPAPENTADTAIRNDSGAIESDLDYEGIYGSKLDELQGVLLEGQPQYNGYELYDLNQDGIKELLVYESGSVYASAMQNLTVYSYDGSSVVVWGEVPSHSGGYWLLDGSIIASNTGLRGLTVCKYTYQNSGLNAEMIYEPDDGYGSGLSDVPELQEADPLDFWTQDLSDRTKLMEA